MAPTRDSVFKEYRDQILEGMARILWLSAYADWAEESPDSHPAQRAKGGQDWDEIAPETPRAAFKAATELMKLYETDKSAAEDIVQLYGFAQTVDMEEDFEFTSDNAQSFTASVPKAQAERLDRKWKHDDAYLFGSMLAWMAMDAGVSWFDDHKHFELVHPDFECHYDGEDLTWSGGLSDVREVSGKLGKITIVNAAASDAWQRTHTYVFAFGAYGSMILMAYGDHLETALEECIGWIAENEPDMLMNDQVTEEYNTAIQDGLSEDAAIEQAETDTTHDGQGNYISSDWTILAEDPTKERLEEISGRKINPRRNGDKIRSVDCSTAYHNTLKADPKKWAALELKGTQVIEEDEEGPAAILEFRDCDLCPSTLTKTFEQPAGAVAAQNPGRATPVRVEWKTGAVDRYPTYKAAHDAIVKAYDNAVDIGNADDTPGRVNVDVSVNGKWINGAAVIVDDPEINRRHKISGRRTMRAQRET